MQGVRSSVDRPTLVGSRPAGNLPHGSSCGAAATSLSQPSWPPRKPAGIGLRSFRWLGPPAPLPAGEDELPDPRQCCAAPAYASTATIRAGPGAGPSTAVPGGGAAQASRGDLPPGCACLACPGLSGRYTRRPQVGEGSGRERPGWAPWHGRSRGRPNHDLQEAGQSSRLSCLAPEGASGSLPKVGGCWNSSASSLQEGSARRSARRFSPGCCPVAARRPIVRRRTEEAGSQDPA